jgi:hypothetical protein
MSFLRRAHAVIRIYNKASITHSLQVEGNIATVFAKFRGEGKSTIRLREPPVDIAISKVRFCVCVCVYVCVCVCVTM